MLFKTVGLLALAGHAVAKPCSKAQSATAASSPTSTIQWETKYTATGAADVAAAAATAKTSSPTSHVKGKAFDRVAYIWFENENYEKAIGDRKFLAQSCRNVSFANRRIIANFAQFASQGILLNNYFGVTHPSEPNYMAAVAGDYFGMENDNFNRADRNISTVIDLLEQAGISWAHYQEDMPYSGFEGQAWKNQKNGANDYVRKHNPAILHDSVTFSEQRLSQIKNLSMIDTSKSMFHKDLKENKLPQWMFITPNMTSDGHDTSVTVAGNWCKTFLTPLLSDPNFMDNTLVVITWDENETYTNRNQILAILIGDAVPKNLVGTTDSTYYNHYSEIATVQANWDLPTLGRWDVGANVYQMVADKTGDKNRQWSIDTKITDYYWNVSYAGYFNSKGGNSRYPAPNLKLDGSAHGRNIWSGIKKVWANSDAPTYYKDAIEVNDGLHSPAGYQKP